MPTIYIDKPDDDKRAAALDALARIHPDHPQVLALLETFAAPRPPVESNPAPAYAPTSRRRSSRKNGGTPSSALLSTAVVLPAGDPPASSDPELSAAPSQFYTWKILASGKECNSLSTALRHRKLAPGDRVRHKERGLYAVVEKPDRSGLTLHRLSAS